VYTNAGTYGDIYGFDPSGRELFFTGLDQQSAWTPTDVESALSWAELEVKSLPVLDRPNA
jgi:hypothetical protein